MKIELVIIRADGSETRGTFSEGEAIDPNLFDGAVSAYFKIVNSS